MTTQETRAVAQPRQARPWTPKTFEEWVKYAPTEYLMCRDQGHRYTDWEGERAKHDPRNGSVTLYQTCPSCGLPRERWISATGYIDGALNNYRYNQMTKFGGYPYLFGDNDRFAPKDKNALVRMELRRREIDGEPIPEIPS